ncbi:MAG: hypothetical protein K9L59_07530 [Desulfobacterales bacterium]|nr:hypothetical protein [Desulfobacterales bacterium]
MKKDLPDFENPPIGEVVCGLAFEKMDDFKGAHIGIFWLKFEKNSRYVSTPSG